jgi:hypothetical protein
MKYLKAAGVLVAVLVFIAIAINNFYVDLIDPYRWDTPIIKEAKDRGFDLVVQRRGGNLIFPWTIFRPYTTHLTFADPKSIKPFRQFLAADTISLIRDDRGRVESWRNVSLVDCESKLFTTLADKEKDYSDRIFRPDGGPMKKWWFEMSEQMISYFCKR